MSYRKVEIDLRHQQFLDELKNNQIAIENRKRDNRESAVFWKLSQLESFPEAIDLNPQGDSLKDLIVEETSRRENDTNSISQDIFKKLLNLTNKDIATFIVQNLTAEELFNFNRNYKKVVSDLKKTNDKISKEQFISFIKKLPKDTAFKTSDTNPDNLFSYYLDEENDIRDDQNSNKNKKTSEDDDMPPLEPFGQPPYGTPDKDTTPSSITFFGYDFEKKTHMRKFMTEILSKEEINNELVSLGGEEQSTKTAAIAEMLKKYKPIPKVKKIGKGLAMNCIYINKAKYYLEGDELKNNNIVIKSANTKKILNQFKPVMKVSKGLSELILYTTKNNFNKEDYDKLSKTEKGIFKRFIKVTKTKVDLEDDEEDELNNKRFHILMGEIQAGNNNPELIKEVRQYAVKGFNEGKLSCHQMNNILLDLSVLI